MRKGRKRRKNRFKPSGFWSNVIIRMNKRVENFSKSLGGKARSEFFIEHSTALFTYGVIRSLGPIIFPIWFVYETIGSILELDFRKKKNFKIKIGETKVSDA